MSFGAFGTWFWETFFGEEGVYTKYGALALFLVSLVVVGFVFLVLRWLGVL